MCILGKIIQKESSSLPQSIKAKNLDNTLFEVANYISLRRLDPVFLGGGTILL